ncbi:MAG: threonine-phosphate decarboxylase CobD [Nitrospirota bacterium]
MIDRSHGGNIWQYPKSLRRAVIDFSVNTNPLGMAKKIKNSIVQNVDKINYYPDPESKYLKNSLAKFHRLSSHNFLIGNGSIELIHLIPRALEAKVVLIPIPTFSEYEFAVKSNNAKCLFVKSTEKNNFKIDISRLMQHIPKADLVFLCNPNNPTGFALERQEILLLLKACKKYNVTLVIDEAFMDFVAPENRITMVVESAKSKHLLVLRSLTKFFVVPGIRIGYVIGHKDTINKLSQHTYPWNVNAMAQAIAEEAIDDKQYIARTQNIIPKERAYLYENLNKIRGVRVYPSDANFLFCKLKGAEIKNAAELSRKLIRQGILIRRCHNFRGLNDRFFRIAVKNREANIKLISALRTVLE